MRAGALRHQITILGPDPAAARDDFGVRSLSFITRATVRAEIVSAEADERTRAMIPIQAVTHRIRIRYCPGVTHADRITFGSRTWEVVSILDFQERHIFMDLACREIQT